MSVCPTGGPVYLHIEQELKSDHRWSLRQDVETN